MVRTNGVTDILDKQSTADQSLGIFYRVPEFARVWVEFNDTEYAKNNFIIPQLGVLQAVNTNKTVFDVDPKTGMLKAIEIK